MMIQMETIQTVLQEEIGGRDHSITNTFRLHGMILWYMKTKEMVFVASFNNTYMTQELNFMNGGVQLDNLKKTYVIWLVSELGFISKMVTIFCKFISGLVHY